MGNGMVRPQQIMDQVSISGPFTPRERGLPSNVETSVVYDGVADTPILSSKRRSLLICAVRGGASRAQKPIVALGVMTQSREALTGLLTGVDASMPKHALRKIPSKQCVIHAPQRRGTLSVYILTRRRHLASVN